MIGKRSVSILALILLPSCLGFRYTLTLEPDNLTIAQGSTGIINISYDYQAAFYGPNPTQVTLENPPQGVQAEPITLHKTNKPTPMTITVASDATVGTFQIQVVQHYVDEVDRTTLDLTITPN